MAATAWKLLAHRQRDFTTTAVGRKRAGQRAENEPLMNNNNGVEKNDVRRLCFQGIAQPSGVGREAVRLPFCQTI
jgi:hypothetical protein